MTITAFIMSIGVMFDAAVWYYSKDVVLFSEENSNEESEEPNEKSNGNLNHWKISYVLYYVTIVVNRNKIVPN